MVYSILSISHAFLSGLYQAKSFFLISIDTVFVSLGFKAILSNPRSSFIGFLQSANNGDFEQAAKYLDLRELPIWMDSQDGPELARKLMIVLDRYPFEVRSDG